MDQQAAFILRISPGGEDKVPEALETKQLIIGWAEAEGLLDSSLSWESFREIVRLTYYPDETNLRKAGAAAGHIWRFVREMKTRDIVVVPYGTEFFVAEVLGPAIYEIKKVDDDSAYRRPVRWLNDGNPIPRNLARSALISRMKTQGTTAGASDLLEEIMACLELAKENLTPTFKSDLQTRLIRETLTELREGRIESFGFERLIQGALYNLGAEQVKIVPRSEDKGADLLATFRIAGAFQFTVAVQAKHWLPKPPVTRDVVEQLIRGIEAESANLGMIITSGTFDDSAAHAAEKYFEERGIRIEMVDGEQFAKLLIEAGVRSDA